MYIRIKLSNKHKDLENKFYKAIRCPNDNFLITSKVSTFKAVKQVGWHSFNYDNEKEKELDPNDESFHFSIWLEKPTKTLAEMIYIGDTCYTVIEPTDEPLKWEIKTREQLNELRTYIDLHVKMD